LAEAAAAQAAYTVLTNISRANVSVLNKALAECLQALRSRQGKDDGIQLGRIAANRIIQLRAADNAELPITPSTSTAAGKWRTFLRDRGVSGPRAMDSLANEQLWRHSPDRQRRWHSESQVLSRTDSTGTAQFLR
jgi:hypothetical protein